MADLVRLGPSAALSAWPGAVDWLLRQRDLGIEAPPSLETAAMAAPTWRVVAFMRAGQLSAFLLSAGIIFVAELGDKSQLVALWFSTRYRWWLVLAGVSLATLVVHLGSVGIGRAFDELLPENVVLIVVGLSFLLFAAWSIRGDQLDDSKRSAQAKTMLGAFGIITASFFVSELGDKTQLATISLAGNNSDSVGVWLGSTVGMVLADALAIGVGLVMGRKLPQRILGIGAACLFVIFGIVALARGLTL